MKAVVYGQILWEQIVLGFPVFAVGHRRLEANFAAWARAYGGCGVKVTDAGELSGAVQALFAHPGPGIVDGDANPNESPMPGKVTYEQAKHVTAAFLRGQPYKVATLTTTTRDKINQLRS